MPENNNKGNYLKNNVDIDTYLDSLYSQEKIKQKSLYTVNNKENVTRKINIEHEEIIGKKSASQNGQVRRPVSQNSQIRKPVPPRYKENGKFVDAEERKKQSSNPVLRWFYNLSKKKQRLVKVISVLLVLTIIFGSALGIFINSKFKMMGNIEEYTDVIYEENLEDVTDINGDINTNNFKEALKLWATTGNDQKMTSKNVVNVLLIGADSRQGTNTGNTDVMMLVSLNKKTKQIKLVSFMRDSYLYIEGKNNSYCAKLNAAFSMGGPETLMNTIENNYKIEIDDFVMVNFESFKSIIEAMDGITVDVQKYEANYANDRYNLSMPYGDGVTLNGEEALAFCRIRGCDADGDISRTRRQRQVINSMIDRVMNASVSDLNNYLNALLPYIYTGFSKSEILTLGMKAITNGWAFYERSELQIPTPETRISGSMGSWVWVVDYQLAAQTLQNELYGSSNITLEDGRTTLIDIYRGTSGSGSSSDGGSSNPIEKNENATTEKVTEKVTEEPITEAITVEDMFVPETEELETENETEPETEVEELPEDMEEEITSDNTLVTIGEDQ